MMGTVERVLYDSVVRLQNRYATEKEEMLLEKRE